MRINVEDLKKAGFNVYHDTNADGSLKTIEISLQQWDNKAVELPAKESGLTDKQREDITIRVHQFQILQIFQFWDAKSIK